MKRRLKPKVKRFLIAFGIIIILFILILSLYKIFLAPVNKKGEEVEFIVNKGETFLTISNELKEQKLLDKNDISSARKMLVAAAFTYVASMLSTLLNILRYALIFMDRDK